MCVCVCVCVCARARVCVCVVRGGLELPVCGVGFVDVPLRELDDLFRRPPLIVRVGVDPIQLRGQAVLRLSRTGRDVQLQRPCTTTE